MCLRMQCDQNDIECLLNKTKSIQWQNVAIPSTPYLNKPMVLLHVQTVGYSIYPNVIFNIVSGNSMGLFDVMKSNGNGGAKGENNVTFKLIM